MGEQVGPVLDSLPDRAQLAGAVADGDDEVRVDEDQQLADLDALPGIRVGHRLDDDQQSVAEALHLGPLLGLDRVLDRELVQVELVRDCLELLSRRFGDAEPDEGVLGAGGVTGLVEGELPGAAPAVLVDGAVDDHRGQYHH